MGDLNKKIKDSKSVIEQSGLNNPNELYNKAINCKKENVFKFRYSMLLKYSFMLLLMAVVSVSSIVIYKSFYMEPGPTHIEEGDNKQILNIKSVEEIKELIDNSNSNSSSSSVKGDKGDAGSSGLAGESSSIDPGMSVYPSIEFDKSGSGLTGDLNIDRFYETNTQEENVDEADIVKVKGQYIYYIPAVHAGYVENYEKNKFDFVSFGQYCVYILKQTNDSIEVVEKIVLEYDDKLIAENKDVKAYERITSTPNNLYCTDDFLIIEVGFTITTLLLDIETSKNTTFSTKNYTEFLIYDVNTCELVKTISLPGKCTGTRLVGDDLYVIGNYREYNQNGEYLPKYYINDMPVVAQLENFYYCPSLGSSIDSYINIYRINLNKNNIEVEELYFLAPTFNKIYVTSKAIYLIKNNSNTDVEYLDENINVPKNKVTVWPTSKIIVINTENELKVEGCIKVRGKINESYWISEHEGYLRVATTGTNTVSKVLAGKYVYNQTSSKFNYLTIFTKNEAGEWEEISSITKGIGEIGEEIESVRFNGNIATIITFKVTDPLYCIDLSDPYNPKITSALKIPGFSVYQHPYNDNYVIGFGYDTTDTGVITGYKIALFDISNIENIVQIGEPLIYSQQTYYDFDVLTNPKSLFLDLENDIFGCDMASYGQRFYIETKHKQQYVSTYILYKIDLNDKEKPIKEFKTINRVDMITGAHSVFDRMVFIGDKYYLLSFDKVYIYQLTEDEIIEVGIKELTTK